MLANRSMPSSTVIPELAYPNVGQAIAWLCDTFGFTLRLRIANHRAQLNVGAGAVVLTEQLQADAKAPVRSAVMVRVEDVNRHYARALRNGARVLQPPTDFPYGERQYSVLDLAGHSWHFSQSLADVDPVEWGGIPGELAP